MKAFYLLLILLTPFFGISQTVYVSNSNDSGPGSFKDAVENAVDGTTIRFESYLINQTININSNITSNSDVRIVGLSDDNNSLYLKFNDGTFFSYGELEIDSIDIHPDSQQDFVFFNINNDFEIKNSFVINLGSSSSARVFQFQNQVSDINVNVENCQFTNSASKIFFLDAPNLSFTISYCYGINLGVLIDEKYLYGTTDITMSSSEFNNSSISTYSALEKLDISNSTFNNFNVENSYVGYMQYFQADELVVNLDAVNFSNSTIRLNQNIDNNYPTDLNISNSNFNSCSFTFGGEGNVDGVSANNFSDGSMGLINISNSIFQSDNSLYNSLDFNFDDLNDTPSLMFSNTTFNADLSINGNSMSTNQIIMDSCIVNGNVFSKDINSLNFNNCIFSDNDNLEININNINCTSCQTYINSCFFSNNTGGVYTMYHMISQSKGYLEIYNSTFYNNDKVLYFTTETEILIHSSTFYQNESSLSLQQYQYYDETGTVIFVNSIVDVIDFFPGSTIIASGYNMFGNNLNNLSETNFDGIDDPMLTLIDDNSSFTPYLLPDYCSIAHDNGDPGYTGLSQNNIVAVNIKDIGSAERSDQCDDVLSESFNCIGDACVDPMDGTGDYSSINVCQQECQDDPLISFNCIGEACVDPMDGTGGYSSLNDCQQVCQDDPLISFNCIGEACVDPMDGTGGYSSLNDCQQECQDDPSITFNCIGDACVDPMDGTGGYSSLNDCQQVCQNASSISENDFKVIIYPNPSSNVFNLELYLDNEIEIRVNNVLGKQVYFESNKSNGEFRSQIDLSHYSKGIYNLTIKTSIGISNHKLILQ
ncbi:MAG: T9SS type A sorting domain-containing protein [Flavobacteriales bacterium]